MVDRSAQIEAWYRAQLDDPSISVTIDGEAETGYSNEVLFATVSYGDPSMVDGSHEHDHDHGDGRDHEHVVVRLPPSGPPLFPSYDLRMQVAVQRFAGAAGVPVPDPIVLEEDPAWLGAPFLVMPLVDGRLPGEVPATCDWLLALSPDEQRAVEVGFFDALAALHRAPVEGADVAALRDPGSLAAEIAWWSEFAAWACEGTDAEALVDLFRWCASTQPAIEPPRSVLWGDVRLGNVIVGDDGRPAAVLDWEMASIGPAESDVAWYTAQARMMAKFFGTEVPGFLSRDEAIAHHEAALGRPLLDMAWHERFAMARSAAVHHRAEVVGALLEGRPVPSPADSFLVTYTAKQLAKPL